MDLPQVFVLHKPADHKHSFHNGKKTDDKKSFLEKYLISNNDSTIALPTYNNKTIKNSQK